MTEPDDTQPINSDGDLTMYIEGEPYYMHRGPLVDKSLTYYLAGPMTGLPEYNYPFFEYMTRILRLNALTILSPHEVPWPEDHASLEVDKLWEYMMLHTRELLERCTGIILLPGWCHSRGAIAELEIARAAKLPVWFVDLSVQALISMDCPQVYETFYAEPNDVQ